MELTEKEESSNSVQSFLARYKQISAAVDEGESPVENSVTSEKLPPGGIAAMMYFQDDSAPGVSSHFGKGWEEGSNIAARLGRHVRRQFMSDLDAYYDRQASISYRQGVAASKYGAGQGKGAAYVLGGLASEAADPLGLALGSVTLGTGLVGLGVTGAVWGGADAALVARDEQGRGATWGELAAGTAGGATAGVVLGKVFHLGGAAIRHLHTKAVNKKPFSIGDVDASLKLQVEELRAEGFDISETDLLRRGGFYNKQELLDHLNTVQKDTGSRAGIMDTEMGIVSQRQRAYDPADDANVGPKIDSEELQRRAERDVYDADVARGAPKEQAMKEAASRNAYFADLEEKYSLVSAGRKAGLTDQQVRNYVMEVVDGARTAPGFSKKMLERRIYPVIAKRFEVLAKRNEALAKAAKDTVSRTELKYRKHPVALADANGAPIRFGMSAPEVVHAIRQGRTLLTAKDGAVRPMSVEEALHEVGVRVPELDTPIAVEVLKASMASRGISPAPGRLFDELDRANRFANQADRAAGDPTTLLGAHKLPDDPAPTGTGPKIRTKVSPVDDSPQAAADEAIAISRAEEALTKEAIEEAHNSPTVVQDSPTGPRKVSEGSISKMSPEYVLGTYRLMDTDEYRNTTTDLIAAQKEINKELPAGPRKAMAQAQALADKVTNFLGMPRVAVITDILPKDRGATISIGPKKGIVIKINEKHLSETVSGHHIIVDALHEIGHLIHFRAKASPHFQRYHNQIHAEYNNLMLELEAKFDKGTPSHAVAYLIETKVITANDAKLRMHSYEGTDPAELVGRLNKYVYRDLDEFSADVISTILFRNSKAAFSGNTALGKYLAEILPGWKNLYDSWKEAIFSLRGNKAARKYSPMAKMIKELHEQRDAINLALREARIGDSAASDVLTPEDLFAILGKSNDDASLASIQALIPEGESPTARNIAEAYEEWRRVPHESIVDVPTLDNGVYDYPNVSKFEVLSADRVLANPTLNKMTGNLGNRIRMRWEKARAGARVEYGKATRDLDLIVSEAGLNRRALNKAWDNVYKAATKQIDIRQLSPVELKIYKWHDSTMNKVLRDMTEPNPLSNGTSRLSKQDYERIMESKRNNGWFHRRYNVSYLKSKEGAAAFDEVLIKHLNGPDSQQIINSLTGNSKAAQAMRKRVFESIRTGKAIDPEDIIAIRTSLVRQEASRAEIGTLHKRKLPASMEADLAPFYVEDHAAAVKAYLENAIAAKHYAQAFGNNHEFFHKATAKLLETGNPKYQKAAAIAREGFLSDIASSEAMIIKAQDSMADATKKTIAFMMAINLFKLAFSAPLNLTQPIIFGMTRQVASGLSLSQAFSNTMDAYRLAFSKNAREFAQLSGTDHETIHLNEIKNLYGGGLFGAEGTLLNHYSHPSMILRSFGFAQAEELNRRVAAVMGKNAVRDHLITLTKLRARQSTNGLSKTELAQMQRSEKFLEELGISKERGKEMFDLASGGLDKINEAALDFTNAGKAIYADELLAAGARFSDAVNFTGSGMHSSPILNDPHAKVFMQFKSFISHGTSFMYDNVVEPAVVPNQISGKRDLVPLMTFLGVGTPLGISVGQFTDIVKGIEREDEDTQKQVIRALLTVGAFGHFGMVVERDMNGQYGLATGQSIKDSLGGPSMSVAGTLFDTLSSASNNLPKGDSERFMNDLRKGINRQFPAAAALGRHAE